MWTRRRAAWFATDTNKHQCRPQINASLPACCVAAEHLARASASQRTWKDVELHKYCIQDILFYSCFLIVMLQDVAALEPWPNAACCCESSGLRPQPSGDHSPSHLLSSKPAGRNSKIIASSASSRKAWCVRYLQDSSLLGWQLNQYFTTVYHQITL